MGKAALAPERRAGGGLWCRTHFDVVLPRPHVLLVLGLDGADVVGRAQRDRVPTTVRLAVARMVFFSERLADALACLWAHAAAAKMSSEAFLEME